MTSLEKRGKHWFYRYNNADGKRCRRTGTESKRETEELALAPGAAAGGVSLRRFWVDVLAGKPAPNRDDLTIQRGDVDSSIMPWASWSEEERRRRGD
jgi:hypothetical protein